MNDPTIQPCPECCARPGQLHTPGCDVERCPRCGGQIISCNCIYEVNDMSRQRLAQDHPDVYFGGPTIQMIARWQAEWGERRLPWTGEQPGEAEAREYGFFCYWNGHWVRCSADHPGARPDLNRVIEECHWDSERQRWVQREEDPAMKPAEVHTLPAGPELDALVAVHCLGWRWWVDPERHLVGLYPPHEEDRRNWIPSFVLAGGDGLTDGDVQCYCDYDSFLPRSSTSWQDAGALVDHFGAERKDGWFSLELQTRGQCLVWHCCWCSEEATGTTAQEAVCRAAVLHALASREVPS